MCGYIVENFSCKSDSKYSKGGQKFIYTPKGKYDLSLRRFSRKSPPLNNHLWSSPVPNITKRGRKLHKLMAKLHIRPSVDHGFHCDFHETHEYSTALCADIL